MARAADGTMTLTGTFALANQVPVSATINGYINDILTEITDSVSRSGKGAALANLSMGGFKLTVLADGTVTTDAANIKQVQNGTISWIDSGGTADAITATYSPAIAAVVDGMRLRTRATGANTITTPTFAPSGLTARTIKKLNGAALAVGDIAGDEHDLILVYVATGTYWNLLNPSSATATSLAAALEATSAEYLNNTANKVLTTDIVWTSAGTVALTDTATVTVDMATFINATLTINGNRTLGQPSNTKVGQSGFIKINTTTNGQTLAYHADWKFASGSDPVLSLVNTATDILFYQVIAANFIYASMTKAVA